MFGSSFAYIGFSSADGGVDSIQTISDFSFQSATNSSGQGGGGGFLLSLSGVGRARLAERGGAF